MNYLSLLIEDIKRRLLYSIKAAKVKLSFPQETPETNLSCSSLWKLKEKISFNRSNFILRLSRLHFQLFQLDSTQQFIDHSDGFSFRLRKKKVSNINSANLKIYPIYSSKMMMDNFLFEIKNKCRQWGTLPVSQIILKISNFYDMFWSL